MSMMLPIMIGVGALMTILIAMGINLIGTSGWSITEAASSTSGSIFGILSGVAAVTMIFVVELAVHLLSAPEFLISVVGAVGLSGLLDISPELFVVAVVLIMIMARITEETAG